MIKTLSLVEGGGAGIVPKRVSAHAYIDKSISNMMWIEISFDETIYLCIPHLSVGFDKNSLLRGKYKKRALCMSI